jgi:hypothetical protein
MKSSYDPDYHPEQAFKYALLRKTQDDLARLFEISTDTLDKWLARYKKLRQRWDEGGEHADAEVAHALWQRATGRTRVRATKIMQYEGAPVIVPYIERFAPDVKAAETWLNVRQKWKTTAAQEHSGPDGEPIEVSRVEYVIVDPKK